MDAVKKRRTTHYAAPTVWGSLNDDRRRADMTYLELEGGGAAFSAGSMCWYPSLAYNRYDNDVARITRNVLTRLLGPRTAGTDGGNGGRAPSLSYPKSRNS